MKKWDEQIKCVFANNKCTYTRHMYVIHYDVFHECFFSTQVYKVCLKSKCTDFLFKFLLDSPEITSDLLQSMTLGKLHNGSNVFSTDHSNTGSHFL